MNLSEIKEYIEKKSKKWTSSLSPTGDEVKICWLIAEVEKLQEDRAVLLRTLKNLNTNIQKGSQEIQNVLSFVMYDNPRKEYKNG